MKFKSFHNYSSNFKITCVLKVASFNSCLRAVIKVMDSVRGSLEEVT